ncbi:MAG TPA: hypothetical protein DIT07_10315 [Sphingobacteriaceae bacterium]|nr:hypothetical protein [Sphingobacteriaceae bacterium]
MKAKLNLTIEQELLSKIKAYASNHDTSVSQIVEDYFEVLSRPKKKESFVEFIDKLPKPQIDPNRNLRKEYYEAKAKKYGL